MKKLSLSWGENKTLTETYRRLHQFHKGNVNDSLIMLAYPSEVKTLIEKKILKTTRTEPNKVLNWYSLDDKGKQLMLSIPSMKTEDNLPIFEGSKVIDFNPFFSNK